jgi:hypothetical protein
LILVDWGKFLTGSSVFVPAINVAELVSQVYEIAKAHKWKIAHRFRIEHGRQGVRFWRLA